MSVPPIRAVTIRRASFWFAAILSLCPLAVTIRGNSRVAEDAPQFSVDRSEIRLGESALLSWNVGHSSKAFISYIGAVETIGKAEVRPEHTTTYTLLADTPSGLSVKRVMVDVSNAKRGDEFPLSVEDFKYPLTTTTKISFTALATQVHSVLQDEMHLSVNRVEYDPDRVRLVFLTSLADDQDLLKRGDARIGARRIAYLVSIERGLQNGTLDYIVRTMVQYRLKIEETWRTEQTQEMYTSSADKVRNRILADLKSRQPIQ